MSRPQIPKKIKNLPQKLGFSLSRTEMRGSIQVLVFFVIWGAVLLFFLACIARYYAIDGSMRIVQDFSKENTWATQIFTPQSRAGELLEKVETGKRFQRITTTPVSMVLSVPRAFESVSAAVTFQTTDARMVELGIQTAPNAPLTEVRPLELALENEARQARWEEVIDEKNGLLILQRSSIVQAGEDVNAAVRDAVEKGTRVAAYSSVHLAPLPRVRLAGYQADPADAWKELPVVLKGTHQFALYVRDETLNLRFTTTDVNQLVGADPLTVQVRNEQNELIHEESYVDDGVLDASGERSLPEQHAVQLPNLPEGVYRIVLSTTNDLLFHSVATTQKKRLLLGSVQFVSPEQSVTKNEQTLYFTSERIRVDLLSKDRKNSRATFDGNVILLPETENILDEMPSQVHVDGEVHSLSIETSPAPTIVYADRGLAFSDDTYFEPYGSLRMINEYLLLDDIDMLVLPLQKPLVTNSFEKKRTITLPLTSILGDRKKPVFVLQVDRGSRTKNVTIDVEQIEFQFTREPLLQRLKTRLQ